MTTQFFCLTDVNRFLDGVETFDLVNSKCLKLTVTTIGICDFFINNKIFIYVALLCYVG